ncbi:MAG: ABC transporter permease subunit [Coriobacteriia bacterium]|nr:ABC transporter permease subunit [Coriobacteriia bacterium]
MSWTLFKATVHQHRTSMFWFVAGLVSYAWMMAWFYPTIGEEYGKLVEAFPPELLAIFGGSEVPFTSVGGYFQTEYLGVMWMLIVSAAVIIYASRALAGEIAGGTMEFVLSQPVSRARVVLTRVAVLVLYAVILATASFVPIEVFGPAYDINLGWSVTWTLIAFGTLFVLAVGGFAMMLSAIFRGGGKPGAIAAGVLGALWIADVLSGASEIAEALGPINIVAYWQPGLIINGGEVAAEAWWLYGAVAVVASLASVLIFLRRDVA